MNVVHIDWQETSESATARAIQPFLTTDVLDATLIRQWGLS